MEITTVTDDLVVAHDRVDEAAVSVRLEHLRPATTYNVLGIDVTTLPRPSGELLCRIATVNDLHFGEVECGRVDNHPLGPIQRAEPGEPPYPETMNHGAVEEIQRIEPAAVFVKGDLSNDGLPDEWDAFERCYRDAFTDRLYVVRGNHDSYRHQTEYAGDQWVELAGVCVALLDTAIPGHTTGGITATQLDWLDAMAATADRPVIVMGHHQQWIGQQSIGPAPAVGSAHRNDDYFGLHPDSSDALDAVAARRRAIVAYTAGHTHRHRVRPMTASGVPSIEVGCVKDFPGTWAEYRVYDGGIMQVVHRISTPEALRWSERCRRLYADFGIDYETYALGALEDRCCIIPLR